MASSLLEFVVTWFHCSQTEGKSVRVGWRREGEVHGEKNKARGREFRGVASSKNIFPFLRVARGAFSFTYTAC